MSNEQEPKGRLPRYQALELPDKAERIEEIGKTYSHRDEKGFNINLGNKRYMFREVTDRVEALRSDKRGKEGRDRERSDDGYER